MAVAYSIIVPAYNEADWLPVSLAAIRQAMAEQPLSGELIVCDNNSSDASAEIARQHGAQVVFEPHNQISRARNRGAAEASGEFLLFVDADTQISPGLLDEALRRMTHGNCVGGGVEVGMDQELRPQQRLGLWAWNWASRTLRLAAGSFFYCRRDAFAALGGFSEAVYASEEVWLSRQMRRWGRRHGMSFCIISGPVAVTSARKLQWFSTGRQILMLLTLLLFPFLVRYRRFCEFWYWRPKP